MSDLAVRKLLAERLQHAYDSIDLIARDVPVGRHVHLLAEMSITSMSVNGQGSRHEIARDQALAVLPRRPRTRASGPMDCARRRPPRSGRSTGA
jgi:hypothetical protein